MFHIIIHSTVHSNFGHVLIVFFKSKKDILFIVTEFRFRLYLNNLELVAMEVLMLLVMDQNISSTKNLKNCTYLHVLPRFLVPPYRFHCLSLKCWMKMLKLVRALFSNVTICMLTVSKLNDLFY